MARTAEKLETEEVDPQPQGEGQSDLLDSRGDDFAAYRARREGERKGNGWGDPFAPDAAAADDSTKQGESGTQQKKQAKQNEADGEPAGGDTGEESDAANASANDGDGKPEPKPGEASKGNLPRGVKKRIDRLSEKLRAEHAENAKLKEELAALKSATPASAETSPSPATGETKASDTAKGKIAKQQPEFDSYEDSEKWLDDMDAFEAGEPLVHGPDKAAQSATGAGSEPPANAPQGETAKQPAKQPEVKSAETPGNEPQANAQPQVDPVVMAKIEVVQEMAEKTEGAPTGLWDDFQHFAGRDDIIVTDPVLEYLSDDEVDAGDRVKVMSAMLENQLESRRIARQKAGTQVIALKKLAGLTSNPKKAGTASRSPNVGPARGGGNAPVRKLEDAQSFEEYRHTREAQLQGKPIFGDPFAPLHH